MHTEALLLSVAMAAAADALSHIALPGIGVAIALHVHPLFGAAAMLFFGALLVWALEDRARMATETIIGVVFSTALAVLGAGAIIVFVAARKNSLTVALVSPDVARTAGIDVRLLDLLYLQMFALTIALGLRYLGVLLMGALIIIPAATAKRLARNLNEMLGAAVILAVLATVLGTWMASWLHRETGPLIVTVAAGCFLLSLLVPRH